MRAPADPEVLFRQIEEQLSARHLELHRENVPDLRPLDAVYTFPYGLLGVQHCESWPELRDQWTRAQAELGSLMRRARVTHRVGPDAYLLFLIDHDLACAADEQERDSVLRAIRSSYSECLKEVVTYRGEDLHVYLDNLTFVPIERPHTFREAARAAVTSLLESAGLPAQLADDLPRTRPGRSTIADRIESGEYGSVPTLATDDQPSSVPVQKDAADQVDEQAPNTSIQGLSVTNFRSFVANEGHAPTTIDLEARIVIVYGENGVGKTCLTQALEWGLTGQVAELDDAVSRELERGAGTAYLSNLTRSGAPANVSVSLSEKTQIHRVGSQVIIEGPNSEDERSFFNRCLDIQPLPYEGDENFRRNCASRLFLGQAQLNAILSSHTPEQRKDNFGRLLGDSGMGRAKSKMDGVVSDLRSRIAAKSRALVERDSSRAELLSEKERVESFLAQLTDENALADPAMFLRYSRTYIAPDSQPSPTTELTPSDLLAAIARVLDVLEVERRELNDSIAQRNRRVELIRRLSRTQSEADRYRREIAEAEARRATIGKQASACQGQLAEFKVALESLAGRRTEYRRLFERVAWWKVEQPRHRVRVERIVAIDMELSQLTKSEDEHAANTRRIRELVRRCGERLQVLQQTQLLASQRVRELGGLEALLVAQGDVRSRLLQAEEDFRAEQTSIGEAVSRLEIATARHEELVVKADELSDALGQLRTSREQFSRKLAEIRDYVHDQSCPLCAHHWPSQEALLEAINQQIGTPSRAEEALADQLFTAQTQLVEVRREIGDTEVALRLRRSQAQQAERALEEYRRNLASRDEMLTTLRLPTSADVDHVQQLLGQAQMEYNDASAMAATLLQEREALEQEELIAQERAGSVADQIRVLGDERKRLASQVSESLRQLDECQLEPLSGDAIDSALATVEQLDRKALEDLQTIQTSQQEAETQFAICRRTSAQEEAIVTSARESLQRIEFDIVQLDSDIRVLQGASNPTNGVSDDEPSLDQRLQTLEALVQQGQQALQAAERLSARHRLATVDQRLARLDAECRPLREQASNLEGWCVVLDAVAKYLDSEQVNFLRTGLEPMRSLMGRLHHRLKRHPVFEDVDWRIDETGLRFWAKAASSPKDELLVQAYMNEAQQNLIALSAFLAASLSRTGQLRLVVLDDPVQAMDEINIYGLLDLIRALSEHVQVVMTTGRSDLFHLARAKFSCLNNGGEKGFTAYRLDWGGSELGTQVVRVV